MISNTIIAIEVVTSKVKERFKASEDARHF